MHTRTVLLEPIFDGQAELASIFDKMVRARLIEYIEEVSVELVWNFGKDAATAMTIAVMPRCGAVEEISNKLPIALFPLSALLDEWIEHIEDEVEEGPAAERYLAWINQARADLAGAADKIKKIHARAAGEDEERERFRKLFDERYPHLTHETFYRQREAAEEELRAEIERAAPPSAL